MQTKISEIADGIDRLSTFVPDIAPPAGFTFNPLALMHGPAFSGDGAAAFRALADDYDRRVSGSVAAMLPSAA